MNVRCSYYYVSIILAIFSLLTIVNDILDFSRIEADKLHLERTAFSMSALLGEIAHSLAPRAEEKHLAFHLHTPPEMPAELLGDPDRLRQIMLNLVGNAIKFTEHGEVEIEVSIGGGHKLPDEKFSRTA